MIKPSSRELLLDAFALVDVCATATNEIVGDENISRSLRLAQSKIAEVITSEDNDIEGNDSEENFLDEEKEA